MKLTVLPALATACATAPIREEEDEDARINRAIRSELDANPAYPIATPQDGIAFVDEDGPCPPDDESCVEEEELEPAPGVGFEVGVGVSDLAPGGGYCRHLHHHHVQRGGFGGFFSSHPSGGFSHGSGGFHAGGGFSAHLGGGAHMSMGG